MPADFSLLGQGPQFVNVLQAYNAGRDARRETDLKGALALYDSNPEAGVQAALKADPEVGIKLRDDLTARTQAAARKGVIQTYATDPAKAKTDALASGDAKAVEAWSQLNEADQKRAHDIADAVGGVAFSVLHSVPGDAPDAIAKRRELLTSQIPNFTALGLPQAKVDELVQNPTMAALDAAIGGSQAVLKLKIDSENKARDDQRAAERDDEMAQYRRDMVDVARGRAATASYNAHKTPTAASTAAPAGGAPWERKW